MIDDEKEPDTKEQAADPDDGQDQEPKQAQEDSSDGWDTEQHSDSPGPFGTGDK